MTGDSGNIFRPKLSDGYSVVSTRHGSVYVHTEQGKTEKKDNISTAKYLAEKYGHKIWLLPRADNMKSADAYNETLGVFQEYKKLVSTKATAIMNAIHTANKQASNVVLTISPRTTLESVRWALNNEVKRSKKIQSVTLIRNRKDVTYVRQTIINNGFKIKHDDFR